MNLKKFYCKLKGAKNNWVEVFAPSQNLAAELFADEYDLDDFSEIEINSQIDISWQKK